MAPVHVLFGVGNVQLLRPEGQVLLVHVAEGDDVFAAQGAEVGLATAPGADQGDVEFVAGGVGAEEFHPGQDEPGSSGEGGSAEEFTSFHGGLRWGVGVGGLAVHQWNSGAPACERQRRGPVDMGSN